jgi:hypothetical protein
MTKEKLNIVVTCTKTKRPSVPEKQQLRNLSGTDLIKRFNKWTQLLNSPHRANCPLEDLYQGAHWKTVLGFSSSRYDIQRWVCSAGLGLLNIKDVVPPYHATFSLEHPDSVSREIDNKYPKRQCPELWWNCLKEWKPAFSKGPRSIRQLAEEQNSTPLLVLAPVNYMRAIQSDLEDAAKQFKNPDLFSIISTGTKPGSIPTLENHLLPTEGKLQRKVSGALRSINTNIANWLLCQANLKMEYSAIARNLQKTLAKCPPLERYEDRNFQSNEQVESFILKELGDDPTKTRSPLLTSFRDSGHKCSVERFKRIFDDVAPKFKGVESQ